MKTSELREGDYHPFYKTYIDTLGEVDLQSQLERQLNNFPEFIASIPDEKWHYAYEEGKWTVAQVLVHVLDAERVFQYRALRIARNDMTPLSGFDQDKYVPFSGAEKRSKEDVIEEYRAIRNSTAKLFSRFSEEDLQRVGKASDVPVSVGALGFICCGHQKHHRNVLRERYL
ncbi:DinB family protein [Poritiphilus flavus]|uniref:DUF664 domain-containing protein n=1 Tax=Poritiphilus flavus TaxID=2697053 RepID=A0A6L9EFT0_9FLAO|nr:DinB family protein [Poritiphilus flavus]NAS13541.1 DUF664 domain-containing protein [Poritiphilus flavus]